MAGSLFERYFFDAMANLGQSLGQRSADNAARRQSVKARGAIDDLLGEGVTNADVMSAINNGQQFDLRQNTVLDPNFSLSKATPDGRSVQENAANELKRRGQYPIGSSGSALQALGSASGKTPVSIEDVRMALRKWGVDEDIIEKELGYYNSKIKEQANATLVPQIMSKYNSGDYTGALQDTLTLRQHDPETASILLSGSVTPRDIYASSQENAKYSRNRNDKLADRDQQRLWELESEYRKINTAKDMSIFNAKLAREAATWSMEDKLAFAQRNPDAVGVLFGKGSAGNGKTIFDSGAFKAANDQIKILNEKVALGGELTPDEQQRFAQANALVNGAFSTFFQPPDQQQSNQTAINLNDYSTAIRFVTQIKEKAAGRIPDVQLAQAFRQEYGLAPNDNSNAFVEKILSDAGIVVSQQERAPQRNMPQEKPWWDRTERAGVAALTFDDIRRAIVENARNNPVEYRR